MRTTIDLDDSTHERLRRQAHREGISLGRLLGRLVGHGLQATAATAPLGRRSGRFQVVGPATADAKTASVAVQKAIDEEGAL